MLQSSPIVMSPAKVAFSAIMQRSPQTGRFPFTVIFNMVFDSFVDAKIINSAVFWPPWTIYYG